MSFCITSIRRINQFKAQSCNFHRCLFITMLCFILPALIIGDARANTPPIAISDEVITDQDTPLLLTTLLYNDSDIDGDDLQITSVDTSGTSGRVALKGGSWNPSFDVSSLNGSNGFVISGLNSLNGDDAANIAGAGDHNGDGFDDLLILPDGANEVYVVFGRANGHAGLFDASELDGTNGFLLTGFTGRGSFGQVVSGAGDVNGDGYDDLLIGDEFAVTESGFGESGAGYVVFGKATSFAPSIDITSLDGSNGFVINGTQGDYLGESVSGAGDINGDGFADVILADDSSPKGHSFVVFGKSSGFEASIDDISLDGSNGFVFNAGYEASGAGDVNNDGYDDLLIGYLEYNDGECYVLFGKAGGFPANFEPAALDGSNGFVIPSIYDGYGTIVGRYISDAGDVNGDGYDDVIIPAQSSQSYQSHSDDIDKNYVVFGKANGFPATMDLASLDGSNGFVMQGHDSVGYARSAGDINVDGYDDLSIGSEDGSESYVVFGKASGFPATFDLSSLDGSNGFLINNVAYNNLAQTSVSDAGDVNGDGYDDLLISFSGTDSNNNTIEECYVVFGGPGVNPFVEYDPAGQFDSLSVNETATDNFLYTVSDGIDSAQTLVTVTVTGTDSNVFDDPNGLDAPELTYHTNGVNLSIIWTAVSEARGYILSYVPYPYNGHDVVATVDVGDTTSFNAELWDGAAYMIAVNAYNNHGNSNYSNVEHFVIELAPPEPPVMSYEFTSNVITISWSVDNTADGYLLSYAPSPYLGPETIHSIDMGEDTSVQHTIPVGSHYYIAVQAYNAKGASQYSNIEEVTADE